MLAPKTLRVVIHQTLSLRPKVCLPIGAFVFTLPTVFKWSFFPFSNRLLTVYCRKMSILHLCRIAISQNHIWNIQKSTQFLYSKCNINLKMEYFHRFSRSWSVTTTRRKAIENGFSYFSIEAAKLLKSYQRKALPLLKGGSIAGVYCCYKGNEA